MLVISFSWPLVPLLHSLAHADACLILTLVHTHVVHTPAIHTPVIHTRQNASRLLGISELQLGQVLTTRQLHTPDGKCEVALEFGVPGWASEVLTTRQLHTPNGRRMPGLQIAYYPQRWSVGMLLLEPSRVLTTQQLHTPPMVARWPTSLPARSPLLLRCMPPVHICKASPSIPQCRSHHFPPQGARS